MPRLPREVFSKKAKQQKEIKPKKSIEYYYLIYSFVGVMIIEFLSLFLSCNNNYLTFWYPLLTQITVLIILSNLVLNSAKLNFCNRKKTALQLLSAYYLFNIVAIIFNIGDFAYSFIVNILVISMFFLIFITSIIKNK